MKYAMNIQLIIFGEVLFDHFPDGSRVLGGAPFNVAWHTHALGLQPMFISRVGTDSEALDIQRLMCDWGMRLEHLQQDTQHQTGSVNIHFAQGEPQYDIVYPRAYDFIQTTEHANTQGILYHGSLALRHEVSRAALASLKAKHQGKIFIDLNLRAPWWQKDQVLALLHDANYLKLNAEELMALSNNDDLYGSAKLLAEQFNLEAVFVTCGADGAFSYHEQQFTEVKPQQNLTIIDTVGAGDAFAAVLLLGLIKHWTMQHTLERAQDFASYIVSQRGAIVFDVSFYQHIVR